MASTLLSYSVLVPLMANAQTVPNSVSTSSVNTESMTTAQVSSVQEPTAIPLGLPASSNVLSVTLTSYNAVPDQTSPTPWLTASGAP